MNKQTLQQQLLKILNNTLVDLPTPNNISTWWNFGSLLGLCLIIQSLTGLFLTIHYTADINLSFDSINHICRNVNYGWLLRTLHANGASFFFFCIYLHIGRRLYYNSFLFYHTWLIGVLILFTTIGTAFIGYVLPWGQMSFWGATVITNLLSAIPYLGINLVQWLWGGYSIDNATLTRFFSFHFFLPFIIIAITIIHLFFLHQTGSNNPLGINRNSDKIPFHPFFSLKDIYGFIIIIIILLFLTILFPYKLNDPDNFIPSNPLITPPHIQPEWYFLFAYAILRSIPNKLGGVIALIFSIFILFFIPLIHIRKFQGIQYYPINQFIFWIILTFIILLTWIGANPVETPYILTGQIFTIFYFSYFFLNSFLIKFWDNYLN